MKALAFIIAMMAAPVSAQQSCGPLEALAGVVAKYKEQLITSAPIQEGVMLVTYANLNTGTWTTAIVSVEGTACVFASGRGFKHHLGKGA